MALVTDPLEVKPLAELDARAIAQARLQDVEFSKGMKAALCRGLYEPGGVSLKEAESIVAQCLKLCDGSKDLLSAVLQEKFIAERSPFYWAIAGTRVRSPPLSYSSLHYSYALLWALLEASAGEISMETQQDILDALYRTENNALYQTIQGKLSLVTGLPHPDMSSTVPIGKLGETTVTKLQGSPTKHQIDFHATQFFDGLLVNSEVTFRSFLANDSLWTLRAVTQTLRGAQSWRFELTEVRSKRVVDPIPLTMGKYQNFFGGKIYNFSRHVELTINPINRRTAGVRSMADFRAIAQAKLQNEGFSKRMKAALCPGLYEPKGISREESRNVLANCLALCDGNRDILSAVLQEKFIAQHSPFYWATAGAEVGNLPRSQDRYPLLFKFFEAMTGEISVETQEDILQALYRTERDSLYRDIQAMLPSISAPYSHISSVPNSTMTIAVHPRGYPNNQYRIDFRATKFFDRLLVDSKITFQSFLASGSLWSLQAVSEDTSQSQGPQSWHFELTEFRSIRLQIHPATRPVLGGGVECTFSRERVAVPHTMRMDIRERSLATFYENRFIGTDRSLSGTIFIEDGY
ncbi:hypothetical protein D9611_002844 [Ephemerocybe angulata]|uniref:Uncharacterized protein n=1 Tax=Ephemerocybe angulata TaxID=980116 RepID=A0A8H5C1H7_9AGAR|nr:hypothetical protein D9611_002844 [Tulosesus angulatus]